MESNAAAALLVTAFAPLLWPPLILVSCSLALAAFILAIIVILRGRFLVGILLIAACPIAVFFSFAMMSLALEPGTWQEKADRLKHEQAVRDRRSPEPSKTPETVNDVLKRHDAVLRKAGIEPSPR